MRSSTRGLGLSLRREGMTLEMAALLNPSITRAVVASSTMALLSVLKMVVLSVPAPLTILS